MLALVPGTPIGRTSRPRPSPSPSLGLKTEQPAGLPLLIDLSADMATLVDEPAEYWPDLDTHLIRNAEATFLVKIRGDSLRAAGLRDGDLVIMDRTTPPLAGSVVAVAVAGKIALRCLGRDATGQLMLEPGADQPAGPVCAPLSLAECEIWGVARWVVQRLWPKRDQEAASDGASLAASPGSGALAVG